MKPSKRKTDSNVKTESKCDCEGPVVAALAITVTLFVFGLIGYHAFSGPKFEYGDCVLMRSGDVAKLVDTSSHDYTFRYGKFTENPYNTSEWVFRLDEQRWNERIYRDIEWADENYIEIPCTR